MLGFGYAYSSAFDIARTVAGLPPKKPSLLVAAPGFWIARIAGESPRIYYTSRRAQVEIRRKADGILREASGLRLLHNIDFAGLTAGSIFGGDIIVPDDGPPFLAPVLDSPLHIPRLASRMDSVSIEECGLAPALFEWRHYLRHRENINPGYALRLPGIATLAEQICGPDNLRDWLDAHPHRIFDLAGVLRRTLLRLAMFIKRRSSTPLPLIVIDDPVMATVDPAIFHKVFWRATRSVVMSLTNWGVFRWYRAPGAGNGHARFLCRLGCRVVLMGDAADLPGLRREFGRRVIWGGISPELLRDGDPSRIGDAVTARVAEARLNGLPILLSPDGPIAAGTPLDNITTLTSIL